MVTKKPTQINIESFFFSEVEKPSPIRVMVTGHRPQKLGGFAPGNLTEAWVRSNLRSLLEGYKQRLGDIEAVSGMALGADTIFCEEALKLQIPVIAAIPFEGQERKWPPKSQEHYKELLDKCSEVVAVSPPGFTRTKMLIRNSYMVDTCTYAIAVWDGSSGGTGATVQLLLAREIPTIVLDPNTKTAYKL